MKGNQEPMLYTTNSAVAALNHVPGFDPLKFLRRTISRKTGEDVMRLDLRYKKLWFRYPAGVCQGGPVGCHHGGRYACSRTGNGRSRRKT